MNNNSRLNSKIYIFVNMAYKYIVLFIMFLTLGCSTTYSPKHETIQTQIPTADTIDKTVRPLKKTYPTKKVTNNIKLCFTEHYNTKYGLSEKNIGKIEPFYTQTGFTPVWVNPKLIGNAIKLLKRSKYHGLNANCYKVNKIDSLFAIWSNNIEDVEAATNLELLLTYNIILYTNNLLYGKLNPKTFHPGWALNKREVQNKNSVILSLIKNNNVLDIEYEFEPKLQVYKELKKEIYRLYRQKRNRFDEKTIKYPGFILAQPDSNHYVLELKQKLGSGNADSLNMVFDNELLSSIKAFQAKHGLNADGKPGRRTYKFLNWTTKRYIDAIKVNMERCRWLPNSIDNKGVVVNIPAYRLRLNTDSNTIFVTKLIVGKSKNETPVFQSKIDYLVFNPCWTIPNSIALKKMLPKIKRDSTYLQKRNMFVGLNGVEQNIDNIDFSQYTKNNFPYKIYQRNGTGNALGKVKFMFPNPYSIYLHDTPSKYLFNKDYRALSHGCIRVQNAMQLSKLILHKLDNNKTPLTVYLNKGYPEIVNLKKRIPLYILYLTCGISQKNGQLQFYNDVYAKDYKVLEALSAFDNKKLKTTPRIYPTN